MTIRVKDPLENPLPKPKGKFDGVDVVILFNSSTVRAQAHWGTIREIPTAKLSPLNDLSSPVFDDLATVDEKQYGLPFWIAPLILVGVNETQLSKAGVRTPPIDWTWADFGQAGSAAGRAGLSWDLYANLWLEPVVRSYGGVLFDPNTTSWGWDRPEVGQGLNTVAELVQNGVLNPEEEKLNQQRDPNQVPFQQFWGKVRPIPGIVVRPLPRGPKGRPVEAEAFVAAVPTTAVQADLAPQYVRDLIGNPAVQMIMAKSGYRPVTADERALAAWREAVGSESAQAVEMGMADLYVNPDDTVGARRPVIMAELRPFFAGRMSLETATATLMTKLPRP